jgi:3-hydroxybutyryl-CoA dehydratase
MESYSIYEMQEGQTASITKKITDEVVRTFSEVSEDCNPVHLDDEFAKASIFGERIAHGMLSAGLISAVVGTKLPGVGAIYLSQEMKFTAPVKIGDAITATAEVLERNEEKNRVKMKTTVVNQDGVVVVKGEALLMPIKKNREDKS